LIAPREEPHADFQGGSATSAIGFTGNWTDPTTGLIYLRARDYDPRTGQFLAIDPAFDSSNQAYAYAADDPVSATDPTGLLCFFGTVGGGPCQDGEIWGEIGNFFLGLIPGVNLGKSISNEYRAVQENCPESTIINLAWNSLGAAASTAAVALAGPLGEGGALAGEADAATVGGLDEVAVADTMDSTSFTAWGNTVRYSPTATAIGDDEATVTNFNRSKGLEGHDVIVHGNTEGQFVIDGQITHAGQVAEAIRNNPAYEGGPINLVTCHAACGVGPELEQIMGVPVRSMEGQVRLNAQTSLLEENPSEVESYW
jgi:RHS repeat-associated protein